MQSMTTTTSRDILAENLRRFRDAEGLSTRAWALSRELDVKLIERLMKNSHSVSLDKLEEVAKACGLEAWHLLIPGVEPGDPPDAPITTEDRALLGRLRKLLNE